MKTLLALAAFLCSLNLSAQRVEVMRIYNLQPDAVASATLAIGTNELVRVLDYTSNFASARFNGFYTNPVAAVALKTGSAFLGPGTLFMDVTSWGNGAHAAAVVEITPVNLPATVQKTSVQPAGYPVKVTLQSSTNLVTWQTATNGDFPATDAHRFFRVNLSISSP